MQGHLFRTHDVLVRYGSGTACLCVWLTDPGPALFVSDLPDANKNIFFQIFFAYNYLEVYLHQSSKIKKS